MGDLIGDLTAELESLKQSVSDAYDELAAAEDGWQEKYDATFEMLRDEGRADGRKSDPAEHVVTSATRRLYPAEFKRWRNAKLDVRRLEEVAQSTRSQVSAHQTRAREAGRLPTVRPRQGPRAVA